MLEGELTAMEFKLVRDIPTMPAEIRKFYLMNEIFCSSFLHILIKRLFQ